MERIKVYVYKRAQVDALALVPKNNSHLELKLYLKSKYLDKLIIPIVKIRKSRFTPLTRNSKYDLQKDFFRFRKKNSFFK